MEINFDPARFVEMLPNMGKGMLAIFIVIGTIALATYTLNSIFSKKQ